MYAFSSSPLFLSLSPLLRSPFLPSSLFLITSFPVIYLCPFLTSVLSRPLSLICTLDDVAPVLIPSPSQASERPGKGKDASLVAKWGGEESIEFLFPLSWEESEKRSLSLILRREPSESASSPLTLASWQGPLDALTTGVSLSHSHPLLVCIPPSFLIRDLIMQEYPKSSS